MCEVGPRRPFIRGDVEENGEINITDPINITDAISLLGHLFLPESQPPRPPFPAPGCGIGRAAGSIRCLSADPTGKMAVRPWRALVLWFGRLHDP